MNTRETSIMTRNKSDMNNIMTRVLTVIMLIIFSMGAQADVKVLFGDEGKELEPDKNGTITIAQKEVTGGTIIITQEDQKDGTCKVFLSVTPDKGYTMAKDGPEVYAVISPNGATTRTPEVSTKLNLKSDDFKDISQKRTYTTIIDSKLTLWVKSAEFISASKDNPTRVDYSGVYYIANKIWNGEHNTSDKPEYEHYFYNFNTPEYNWYLVPAADPHQSSTWEDAYYSADSYATKGDPARPFLTTYRTNRDNNSVWIVKKTGSKYYIIHALTGKYVKYEPPISANLNRRSVHLEEWTDPDNSPGNIFQFTITSKTSDNISGYNIKPTISNGTNVDGYLNPAGDNWPYYYSHKKNNQNIWCTGIVGYYNNTDGGSLWPFENAKLTAPTIEYDTENNQFTISDNLGLPEGYEILYTTDGSDPEIDGSTTRTYTSESAITLATIGSNPLKAVVARYGFILTEIASIKSPNSPTITPTPGDCRNTVTITADEGTDVYYTIDGTDPTNSSSHYVGPFVLSSDVNIKAVAYSGNLHSGITTLNYSPSYSAKPAITQSGATITISGTGTIFYTINGGDPTTGSTQYIDPFTLSGNSGDVFTIKAVAKDGSKELSCVAEKTITMGYYISDLASLEAISSHLGDLCILTADINDASGLTASISGFTGEFDGGYYTINGLTKPLFTNLNGGTVKNVRFSGVNITSGTNVGAVCDEADGTTKIYNCGVLSGSVSGTNVGGLVGHIKSGSSVRVVNCYNYADVSGGNYAAGIVGKNDGTVASDNTVGNVRIALCMMYGNVSGATNISPVYGGNHIDNVQKFTEYNYYLYSNERNANGKRIVKIPYTAYNDQLAIDKDDYLKRFPFYRHILNTHRELASYFLFGDYSVDHVAEIGHWSLDKNTANYPIVGEWETNTRKILDAPVGTTVTDAHLGTTLNVSIKIGNNSYTAYLPITDMDEANYDFTYGKVVLPFANEFEVNTDYTKICTGWKITGITGGTSGTFSNYNVSDRDCTTKDLFSTTGFIFAQGGYYVVPYNVTAIEITANFATAYYLSDATYDVGYDANYANPTGLGGSTNAQFHGQPIYNNVATALAAMGTASTPHSQAIVLVGNYHFPTETPANKDSNPISSYTDKAFTLMSIDADNNQEPDYGWYSNNFFDRPAIAPVRFDFVAQIPLGMAANVTNSKGFPGIPIWRPRGWFEMTETSLCLINQFELNDGDFTESSSINNRCIINGGYFTQMVRARNKAANKLCYFQIGGNAYIKEFYPGNHSAVSYAVTLAPVNVTGGEIEECFMTGYGKGTAVGSDIYFWCAGGKIGKFLGAYMEKPKQTATTDGTVNMTAIIDHAKITKFFGGGTSPSAPITGNINVTINNSTVDFYCGGPEFGNMASGKTVTTNATNTTFGKYYGAGFGGTSITYFNDKDDGSVDFSGDTKTYPDYFTYYYLGDSGRLKSRSGYGIGTCYKFEYIYHSYDKCGVARFYTGYAKFDLATTGNVTNNLNGCTITNDFYGAGCQGKVDGTVTSILTDCTISGSAYGGGFKASANEVDVYPTERPELSVFTKKTGLFSDFGKVDPVTFTWESGSSNPDDTGKKLYTGMTEDAMKELGNVTGAISVTIDGGSVAVDVFGGGNESKSLNNTTVTLKGNLTVGGDVFGGGNQAGVSGSATVNIEE